MGALCLFLTAACVFDYSKNKIPNYIILFIGILGMLENARRGWDEMVLYLAIAGLVMALLYPLFKLGCLGAGDVKLLGVTAGFLPIKKILIFLFVSMLIASVISLIKMLRSEMFWQRVSYFFAYLSDVVRRRALRLYRENLDDDRDANICLSGPILISILLYLGGVY